MTEFEIVRLGAQGDGIAETDNGPRYIPFALPGEKVQLSGMDMPEVVSASSADRAAPVCRHFGTCGGCVAQHMGDRLYADWKRAAVVDALRQHGLQADVAPLQRLPPGTRRRAVLTSRVDNVGNVQLGYHRRKSDELVHIHECPILVPEIAGRLPALAALAAAVPGRDARLTVLATAAGLDVAIDCSPRRPGPDSIAALGRIAAQHRLARVAVNGEIVVERAVPTLSPAGVGVVPTPGAFVQAAEAAEHAMARLVMAAMPQARHAADLFCGLGAFTFAMARRARVLAVDGNQAAIAAVAAAARRGRGLKPIETRVRDLFREPLSARELKSFDAVAFDPPRAGAKAQAAQLALSDVPVVVAVSCDPGTLARDLRLLVDGGYTIEAVTPIDQFLFSAHVEAVAVLRRQH